VLWQDRYKLEDKKLQNLLLQMEIYDKYTLAASLPAMLSKNPVVSQAWALEENGTDTWLHNTLSLPPRLYNSCLVDIKELARQAPQFLAQVVPVETFPKLPTRTRLADLTSCCEFQNAAGQ